ncbi:hypothetical protein GCM10018954_015470 [Kutzneria kofuensis]
MTKAQKLAADGLAEARRAVAALREDKVPDARAIADLVTAFRLESGATRESLSSTGSRATCRRRRRRRCTHGAGGAHHARKHAPGRR